jgi:hypothetical protein
MAASNAFQRKPTAVSRTVLFYGLRCVNRTRGEKAAILPEQWTDTVTVNFDQNE